MYQRAGTSSSGGGADFTSAVQSTPRGQATQTISIPDSGITEGIIVAYTYTNASSGGVQIGSITNATFEEIADFMDASQPTYSYDFRVYKVKNITSQTLTVTFSVHRTSPAMTQAIFIY